jgi:hypothetical protein
MICPVPGCGLELDSEGMHCWPGPPLAMTVAEASEQLAGFGAALDRAINGTPCAAPGCGRRLTAEGMHIWTAA